MIPASVVSAVMTCGIRCGRCRRSEDQPERIGRLHHRHGWTALAFWDRTGDNRHGSVAVFVADGEHAGAEMLKLFEQTFPAIWKRITAAGPVRLHPGNVDPPPRLRIAEQPTGLRVPTSEVAQVAEPAVVPVDPVDVEAEQAARAPRRRLVR